MSILQLDVCTEFLLLHLQLLCSRSTNTINSKNKEGYTPLLVACRFDKPECVHALLDAGADVNISAGKQRDDTGEVARYESVQVLLL